MRFLLATDWTGMLFRDRFKVFAEDFVFAQAVVGRICNDGQYCIKQMESMTLREAARLQRFPDDGCFEGVSERPSRTRGVATAR